jgi:serine phosphatase RsbU (regulator of sigma subunit)/CHASE3 domain sensor protein
MSTFTPERSFSVERRLGRFVAVSIAVLCVAGVTCVVLFNAWARAADDRREVRSAVDSFGELSLSLSDQESGVRGYLLSGDESFLDPYNAGVATQIAATRSLSDVLARAPVALAALQVVNSLADQWRTSAAEVQIQQRRESPTVDTALVADGKRQFDMLRAQLETLQAALNVRVEELDQRVVNRQRVAVAALVVSVGFLAVMAIVTGRRFHQWVFQPLKTIGVAARQVSLGNPMKLPSFQAKELNDVSEAVNALQQSLAHERDNAVRSYETLQQSAVLALHVRSQLTTDADSLDIDGWSTASASRSAEGVVAGDCHDMGLLSPTRMYLLVVDVTGHGPLPALNALTAKSLLRSGLRAGMTPGGALTWLSNNATTEEDMELLTAFVAVISLSTGRVQYASAGHPPAYLVKESGLEELNPTGPLLGAFPATWGTDIADMPVGATLVVYSDGLTEVPNEHRIRLGEDAVKSRLSAMPPGSDARAVVQRLVDLFDEFRSGPPADDLTILAVTFSDHDALVGSRDSVEPGMVGT